MEEVTKKMESIIKKIKSLDGYRDLNEDFSVDGDTRGWDVPMKEIWEAGNKSKPIWWYGDDPVYYFIGEENEVLNNLTKAFNEAIKNIDKEKREKKKEDEKSKMKEKKQKERQFEKLKAELGK